jgi:hypothetical protein
MGAGSGAAAVVCSDILRMLGLGYYEKIDLLRAFCWSQPVEVGYDVSGVR